MYFERIAASSDCFTVFPPSMDSRFFRLPFHCHYFITQTIFEKESFRFLEKSFPGCTENI